MKTHLKLTTAVIAIGCSLMATGCAGDRPSLQDRQTDNVDPCWIPRYSSYARKSVLDVHGAQVANGHDLHQTLMNYHFEQGSGELNPAGRAKLDQILRQRPTVDGKLNLQTARDINYDEKNPGALQSKRADLDSKRINSIQQYVSASTAGRNVTVDVTVKDPSDMSMDASGPSNAVRGLVGLYQSGIQGVAGGQVAGAGGGAAPTAGAASGAPAGGGGGGAPR
jgi:hypothetical protein